MGNICNGAHDREDMKETNESLSKNISVCEFSLSNNCTIELVLGNKHMMKEHVAITRACFSFQSFNSKTLSLVPSLGTTPTTTHP